MSAVGLSAPTWGVDGRWFGVRVITAAHDRFNIGVTQYRVKRLTLDHTCSVPLAVAVAALLSVTVKATLQVVPAGTVSRLRSEPLSLPVVMVAVAAVPLFVKGPNPLQATTNA